MATDGSDKNSFVVKVAWSDMAVTVSYERLTMLSSGRTILPWRSYTWQREKKGSMTVLVPTSRHIYLPHFSGVAGRVELSDLDTL